MCGERRLAPLRRPGSQRFLARSKGQRPTREAYGIAGAEEEALLARCAAAGGLREVIQVIEKAYAVAAGPRVTLKYLKAAAGSTGLSAIGRGRHL